MGSSFDTPRTDEFLTVFQSAWKATMLDYDQRRINSEHTLQANLYHHLLRLLPPTGEYRVFAEVTMHAKHYEAPSESLRRVIDLLVVHKSSGDVLSNVIAAIELKYTPRAMPLPTNIEKDLRSLELVSVRRERKSRVELPFERFLASGPGEEEEFKVSSQRKLIYACVIKDLRSSQFTEELFWSTFKLETWRGKARTTLPDNLLVAVGKTHPTGPSVLDFFGPPINRLKSNSV
jgi:hypothetical protein